VVRNCMTHRINWKEYQNSITTIYNFKWQQNSIGLDFANISKTNTLNQVIRYLYIK